MSRLWQEIGDRRRSVPSWFWISVESLFLVVAIVGAAVIGKAAADYLATGAQPPWPPMQPQMVTEADRGYQILSAGLLLATLASAVSIWGLRWRWQWLALRLAFAPITMIAIVAVEFPYVRLIATDAGACLDDPTCASGKTIPAALEGGPLSSFVLNIFLLAWLGAVIFTIFMAVVRSRSGRRHGAVPLPSR